jgi:hypothetical protein
LLLFNVAVMASSKLNNLVLSCPELFKTIVQKKMKATVTGKIK